MYIQKVCRPGCYGNGCGHLCNVYCINNEVCNHVDGVCLTGSQDGYIGKYCKICEIIIHFLGLQILHLKYAIYLFYDHVSISLQERLLW